MNVAEWLATRDPQPPARLRDRLGQVTAGAANADAATIPGLFVGMARAIVAGLADGGRDRSAALDLLTADALVTYAFEYVAESGGDLALLATDTERRFAELAGDRR